VSFGLGRLSDAEISEAVQLAAQAIEIGKDDPDALWMGAQALSFSAREHGMAANAGSRALMFNPNSAHAWMTSKRVSCFRNQPDGAIEAFRRAMGLSPLDPLIYQFTAGVEHSSCRMGGPVTGRKPPLHRHAPLQTRRLCPSRSHP